MVDETSKECVQSVGSRQAACVLEMIMRLLPGRTGSLQTLVALCILGLLTLIAASVIAHGLYFAPATNKGSTTSLATQSAGVKSFIAAPAGFHPASTVETYNPENLYEKIDGKAEMYLDAGFKAMTCQRFASMKDGGDWLEVFAYDMGDAVNAFGVYGQQRRSDVVPLDVTPFSYKTVDGIYFAAGGTYVEIHGSSQSSDLEAAMLAVARTVAGTVKVDPGIAAAIATFPKEDQVAGSAALYPTEAFGCSFLDDVYTMQYSIGGKTVMAFASPRESAQAAAKLANDYEQFVIQNGGADVSLGMADFPAKVLKLYGTTEIVFARGSIVAGIHAAEDQMAAMNLAKKLWDNLPDTETPTAVPAEPSTEKAQKETGETYEEQQ
jgi:hypothetical protein